MKGSRAHAIVAAGLGCMVSAQAFLVAVESSFIAFDARIVEFFAGVRTPEMVFFFAHLSALGNPPVVVTFTLGGVYLLHRIFRKQYLALGFLIAIGGTILTNIIMKDLIGRARPWDISLIHELSFSFPSGHASLAAAFYGFLIYALWQARMPNAYKIGGAAALGVLAFLIGFSRVYLGVHYPTDILAGFGIGIIWVILGTHAIHLHEANLKRRRGRS